MMGKIHCLYVLSVVAVLSSCTKMDLCTESAHPHPGQITTSYDWGKSDLPQAEMMVFASHALTGHSYFSMQPVEGGMLSNNWNKPEEEPAPLAFAGGIYNLVACSCHDDGYNVPGRNAFLSGQVAHVSPLSLVVNQTAYPDFGNYVLKSWADNNKGVRRLRQIKPVYVATAVADVRSGNSAGCTFVPRKLTQHLTFELAVNTPEGITVDSLLVELSGVVSQANLTTGLLKTDTYGRIYFPMYKSGLASSSQQLFIGEADVLGIVPGQANMIFGAGIMNVGIFSGGRIDFRKFNLTSSLKKAELLRYDEVLGGEVKNKSKADIHIEFEYAQGPDGESGSQAENSIIWIDSEDGSHDIDEET